MRVIEKNAQRTAWQQILMEQVFRQEFCRMLADLVLTLSYPGETPTQYLYIRLLKIQSANDETEWNSAAHTRMYDLRCLGYQSPHHRAFHR